MILFSIKDRHFEVQITSDTTMLKEVGPDGMARKVMLHPRDGDTTEAAEIIGAVTYATIHVVAREPLGTMKMIQQTAIFRNGWPEFSTPDDLDEDVGRPFTPPFGGHQA